MEFMFRAVDNKRTPSPSPPPPRSLPTLTYFSHRSLRGGFSSIVPAHRSNSFPMAMSNASEALRRELEKEQIRREIIAGGIARRRELEEEVTRELALERGWGQHGFSFDERMSMRLNPFHDNSHVHGVPQPQRLQLMPADHEFKPSPETHKDEVVKLAKPDRDLYEAKRKAVAPPDVDGGEHFAFGLKKKPKEEWSCALCQVSATSERGLTEHLQGKKHRAKETALRNQKIGLDAKADGPSLQLGTTRGGINQPIADKGAVESKNEDQLVQKDQNIKGLENENGTSEQEAALKKMKKMKFWCEICQVGTASPIVMEGHKKGKKHLARMKIISQNNGSAPLTSSVSLEAPGLIKDTDAANKETDQEVTQVMKKETIIKMVNTFADSDEVSDEDTTSARL